MIHILLERIITENGEPGHLNAPTSNVSIEGGQELGNGGGAVKPHHMVGAIEHVDRDGVGQRMVVRVLEQDGEHFHPGWLGAPCSVPDTLLQRSLAVGSVLARLSPETENRIGSCSLLSETAGTHFNFLLTLNLCCGRNECGAARAVCCFWEQI